MNREFMLSWLPDCWWYFCFPTFLWWKLITQQLLQAPSRFFFKYKTTISACLSKIKAALFAAKTTSRCKVRNLNPSSWVRMGQCFWYFVMKRTLATAWDTRRAGKMRRALLFLGAKVVPESNNKWISWLLFNKNRFAGFAGCIFSAFFPRTGCN